MWLEENKHLEAVQAAVAVAKKKWSSELNNLYVSPIIAKALMAADPHFATSEAEAGRRYANNSR